MKTPTPTPTPTFMNPAAVETTYHVIEYFSSPIFEGQSMYARRFVQDAGRSPATAKTILESIRLAQPTKTFKLARQTVFSDVLDV